MICKATLLAAMCLTFNVLGAISKEDFDLATLIQLGLENNFNVKSRKAELEIYKVDRLVSWKTLYLPRLDANAYSLRRKYFESYNNYSEEWQKDNYWELKISQNLFNGFEDWHRHNYNKLKVLNGKLDLDFAKEDFIFNITQKYINFSLLKNKINIEKKYIDIDSRLSKLAKLKYDNGRISKDDLNRATINSIRLKKNILELERELGLKKAEIAEEIGVEKQDLNIKINESPNLNKEAKELLAKLTLNGIDSTVKSLHDKYTKNSKLLLSAKNEYKMLDEQRNIAMKNYYPEIYLEGVYSKGNIRGELYVGINLSLPVFEHLDTFLAVKKASQEKLKKNILIRKQNFSVLQNLKKLCADMEASYKMYQLTKEQNKLFRSIYGTTFLRFKKGVIDMKDVLEDQRDLNEAEGLLFALKSKIELSELNVRKLIGDIYVP